MKKFNTIILPPDTHQFTIKDRLYDENHFFNQIVDFFFKIKKQDQNILIKYRGKAHKNKFPNNLVETAEKGRLLDFCDENCNIIGPVNSATIECLQFGFNYFCYRYDPGLYKNLSHTYTLDNILYVAKDINQMMENFEKKKIFKNSYSVKDLTHEDGKELNKIVEQILKKIN